MINEEALSFKRGDLVEFTLHLGGGPKKSRGLVLNTAVLFGRGARQLWIVDIDGASPQQESEWLRKKHIVHEEDIIARIPSVMIGTDTLLRENPISFPVQNGGNSVPVETPAITVTIPFPVTPQQEQMISEGNQTGDIRSTVET
jgi:hypothetical protein